MVYQLFLCHLNQNSVNLNESYKQIRLVWVQFCLHTVKWQNSKFTQFYTTKQFYFKQFSLA